MVRCNGVVCCHGCLCKYFSGFFIFWIMHALSIFMTAIKCSSTLETSSSIQLLCSFFNYVVLCTLGLCNAFYFYNDGEKLIPPICVLFITWNVLYRLTDTYIFTTLYTKFDHLFVQIYLCYIHRDIWGVYFIFIFLCTIFSNIKVK